MTANEGSPAQMAATKNHDYHLVNPSPWPLVGAIAAFFLFGGLVMWFHENRYGPVAIGIGAAGVLGSDRHLGPPLADPRRPRRTEARAAADDPPRHDLHLRPGVGICPRAVRLQRQHLWRNLLHGDRLPRLPRHRRDDLPHRVPDPDNARRFHPQAAFRLRGGCLVLAFRRRRVAIPVHFDLPLGRLGRAARGVTPDAPAAEASS